MNFTDIKSLSYTERTVVIDGVQQEISRPLKEVDAVQYHDGRDYLLEEPLMTKVPFSKYQYVLDQYEVALGIEEVETIEVVEDVIDTEAQTIATYKTYYLAVFNAKLALMDYDDIATVTMWANKEGSSFQAEAKTLLNWYEAIINKNYEILNAVKAGTREMPDKEQYLSELPSYATYEL